MIFCYTRLSTSFTPQNFTFHRNLIKIAWANLSKNLKTSRDVAKHAHITNLKGGGEMSTCLGCRTLYIRQTTYKCHSKNHFYGNFKTGLSVRVDIILTHDIIFFILRTSDNVKSTQLVHRKVCPISQFVFCSNKTRVLNFGNTYKYCF